MLGEIAFIPLITLVGESHIKCNAKYVFALLGYILCACRDPLKFSSVPQERILNNVLQLLNARLWNQTFRYLCNRFFSRLEKSIRKNCDISTLVNRFNILK